MHHLWRVAGFEYRRNVFKKSFLWVILSVPFFVTISIGMGLFMESRQDRPQAVGYIDEAGLLAASQFPAGSNAARLAGQGQSEFIAYANEEAARAALEKREIQAYFLLPATYPQTRHVDVVYLQRPSEGVWQQFFDFLQLHLLADQPPEVAYRLAVGSQVTVRSLDGRREVSRAGPTFGLLMPLFITLAFLLLLVISSGYMMEAVTEEKENRTIEILLTSISPSQLMAGKILGIVATSLTLLLTWTAVLAVGIFIANQAGVGWFSNLSMDGWTVLATVAIAIPAYALAASLMIALGAMVNTTREAQSVSSIFIILHLVPFYISMLFVISPHHPIGVVLSLLPFTALVTTGMRNLFTIVPAWQVIASVAVQVLCAFGAVWLAGRALRIGMLQSGQRLNWRGLLRDPLKPIPSSPPFPMGRRE
jgi:ABC-2 type transport system permease protein